uniref:Uncharacterized protein n=1 Tax=Rhizophora mucronata TaxID=61149 RepID=A0A2P2QM97_RHIMU
MVQQILRQVIKADIETYLLMPCFSFLLVSFP